MPEPDFVIRSNDTVSVIRDTLTDDDGNAVDLTGSAVRFHMVAQDRTTGSGPLDAAAVIEQTGIDPNFTNKGVVRYTWAAGNTTLPGWYFGEWQVTFGAGGVQTYPNGAYINILIAPELI